MERLHAYQASDGTLHANSRDWVEHEFFLMLCACSMNASKDEAAELVDRFKDFEVVYNEFNTDVRYGEGGRKGLVLDRRTLVKDQGPKVDTTVIPPDGDHLTDDDEGANHGRGTSKDGGVGLQEPAPEF